MKKEVGNIERGEEILVGERENSGKKKEGDEYEVLMDKKNEELGEKKDSRWIVLCGGKCYKYKENEEYDE